MKAIEFETVAKEGIIQIPEEQSDLYSKHLRIIALMSEEDKEVSVPSRCGKGEYNFGDLIGKLEWQGDAILEQRKLRDEWQQTLS